MTISQTSKPLLEDDVRRNIGGVKSFYTDGEIATIEIQYESLVKSETKYLRDMGWVIISVAAITGIKNHKKPAYRKGLYMILRRIEDVDIDFG